LRPVRPNASESAGIGRARGFANVGLPSSLLDSRSYGPDPMAPRPAYTRTADTLRADPVMGADDPTVTPAPRGRTSPVIGRRMFLVGAGAVVLAAPLAV